MVCLGERVQDALAHTSPRGELKVPRAPPDATCVRACVPLQSSLAANPLTEMFLDTFCCPRWAAWVSLWASPCALDPRPHDGQATPSLAARKIVASLTELPSTDKGSHIAGAPLAVLCTKKISSTRRSLAQPPHRPTFRRTRTWSRSAPRRERPCKCETV